MDYDYDISLDLGLACALATERRTLNLGFALAAAERRTLRLGPHQRQSWPRQAAAAADRLGGLGDGLIGLGRRQECATLWRAT